MNTTRVTITMDNKLVEELKGISKEEQRSFSRQIVYLIKKGKEAEEPPTVAVKDKCICENNLTVGVDCFNNKNKKWICMFCGRTETIKDCGCNHMFYDCPYCGKHLT